MERRDGNDARQSPIFIGGFSGRIAPVKTISAGLGGRAGEPVFCGSCSHFGGYVTVGMPPGVFFLCGAENGCGCNCEKRFGMMPEMRKAANPEGYRSA